MDERSMWKVMGFGVLVVLKVGLACAKVASHSSSSYPTYDPYASSAYVPHASPSLALPEEVIPETTVPVVRELGVPLAYATAQVLPMTKAERVGKSEATVSGKSRETAYSFDAETDTFPNRHDLLLASLAELGGKDLKGVRFEEEAPTEDSSDDYTLVAFMDGKRYALTGRNLGDWYDVPASVGLVNTLLKDRKSATRLVTVETGDQTVTVLADTVAALSKTPRVYAHPDDALKDGKAFEAQAIRELLSGAR